MTTSGPRYHIPFPRAFLSLNTPISKLGASTMAAAEPEVQHSFLSNRSSVPRHSSVSSVSTAGSSVPSSPASVAVDASPIVKQATPTFLALNSKYAAPVVVAGATSAQSQFLSNKV